jgi:GNAT superfamily N-acetyltransferase
MSHAPRADKIHWRTEARTGDIEAVRDIVASSGFFNAEEVDIAMELVQERLGHGAASGYHFIFAETDGKVAGYACYGPIAGTHSSFDLYWVAVHQSGRRGGLGREIMARAEQAIAQAGGTRIYVETSSRSQYEPTRNFYLRLGYRQDAVLADFYGPGDSKVIYVKEVGRHLTA